MIQETPNEKASILVLTYLSIIGHKMEEAKQCAILAVDEVLKYSKAHGFIGLTDEYEEVKKEINNL